MTMRIFFLMLTKLDANSQDKIYFFFSLDNVSNYKIDDESIYLTNIELQFLPANTMCKIQTLDRVIIRSFKTNHKKKNLFCFLDKSTYIKSCSEIYILKKIAF